MDDDYCFIIDTISNQNMQHTKYYIPYPFQIHFLGLYQYAHILPLQMLRHVTKLLVKWQYFFKDWLISEIVNTNEWFYL